MKEFYLKYTYLMVILITRLSTIYSKEERLLESTYPFSCNTYLSEGIISSGIKTVWPTGPLGASYDVYCEGSEDGGWMLILTYVRAASESAAMDSTTIPTSPSVGYSHVKLEDMNYTVFDIEDLRFYCTSSLHDRVIHFRTSNTPAKKIAVTGDQTTASNTPSAWISDYVLLTDGDSAYLPSQMNNAYTLSSYDGLGSFPFYRTNTYHWGIGGVAGSTGRYECDDAEVGTTGATRHNVYARMVEGRPTAAPTSPSQAPTSSFPPSPSPTLLPTLIPTPNPIPNPTPLPTLDPTIVPTSNPTSIPTSLPTLNPTIVPSSSPTPIPSSLPSPLPSSPYPTQVPTAVPSLLPLPLPSFLPTPLPSSYPSPPPTIYCELGTYFDGVVCRQCSIGRYASTSSAPFAENCTLCAAGKYNTATGSYDCASCDTGKLSSPDRSYCRDCNAGEYSLNNIECVSCEYGKYAPSALDGACLTCSAGFYTNNRSAATNCISCTAGYYSVGLTDHCTICPAGTSSSYSAVECTNCSAGQYAESAGSTTCSNCAAGTVSAQDRAYSCEKCSPGTYQSATGQASCFNCAAGKYESQSGSSSCSSCSAAYSSDVGSTWCNLAFLHYFKSTKDRSVSEACPNNANCAGGNQAPAPNKGFWVDRSDYDHVDNIYACSRLTCVGADSNHSCWNYNAYNHSHELNKDCDVNALLCLEGSCGPLCGSCEVGYIYRSELKQCGPCDDAKTSTFIAVGFAGVIGAMIGGMITGVIPVCPMMRENSVVHFARSLDGGSLKVLWVTFQIILSTSWNLDIKYPSPFSDLLGVLSVFSLDFLALECFQGDVANRYFVTVYLWSCLPIIAAALVVLVMMVRLCRLNISVRAWMSSDALKPIVNQHIWLLLLLSYLVLPPVAMKQLQSLDCIPFGHDSSSYLRADTGIDCESSKYQSFRSVVVFFIILYQSIPIVWMVLLYRQRAALDPITSNHDEKLALFIRDHNPDLASLRFLFHDYNCNKWWFEVAEMYRRVLLVGVLPLVSPITATRASMGCVLAIASVAYYREERPYRVKFTNFIAHLAQFVILITFYGALSIDTGVMMDFGLKDLGMGLFLVITNLSIFGLCVWLGYIRYLRDRTKIKRRRGKANQVENAEDFTPEKFQTTFEFLSRASVPISHVLAFHYTSLKLAKMARHSGIPAASKFDGVVLTLRQPHMTNNNDRLVFKTSNDGDIDDDESGTNVKLDSGFPNDAVVVLALPRYILEPLPGYEDDGCLLRISTAMLKFMRPCAFTGVVDPGPWLNELVLLSPSPIIRCYQLNKDQNYVSASDRVSKQTNTHNFSQQNEFPTMLSRMASMSSFALLDGKRQLSSAVVASSSKQDEIDFTHCASVNWVRERKQTQVKASGIPPIVKVKSMLDYIEGMRKARKMASSMDLKPLYHFTQESVVPLIMQGGLRMSTQGQGDGGVYFSTLGPASYKYGTDKYEENIIKACFGVHRMREFKGLGKLNAVLVYGCDPRALQQAPGGRDHAKFVPRSLFEDLSLPHADGNYFLRPEQIITVFLMEDVDKPPSRSDWYNHELELEKDMDKAIEQELLQYEELVPANNASIEKAATSLLPPVDVECIRQSEEHGIGDISPVEVVDGIEMMSNPLNIKLFPLSNQSQLF